MTRKQPPDIRDDFGDMEPLDCLLRHVVPQVPSVPYEMALDSVREAYKEFARRTGLLEWRWRVPFQRGVSQYVIEPPEGYSVYSINLSRTQDREFVYRYVPDADYWYYYWGQTFRILGNNILELRTAPSKDYDYWYMTLVLIPDDCAKDIPKEISDAYGRAIATGAVGYLLKTPGQGFTNVQLARDKEREFNTAIGSGKMLALTQRGSSPARMRPVRIL